MFRVPFGPQPDAGLPPMRIVPDPRTLILPLPTAQAAPAPPRIVVPPGSNINAPHWWREGPPRPDDPAFGLPFPGQPPAGVPMGAIPIPDLPDLWHLLTRQLGPQAPMLHRWTTPYGQGWAGPHYAPPFLPPRPLMPPAQIPQPDFTSPGAGQPWVPTR